VQISGSCAVRESRFVAEARLIDLSCCVGVAGVKVAFMLAGVGGRGIHDVIIEEMMLERMSSIAWRCAAVF
jgi:hypothetical protein